MGPISFIVLVNAILPKQVLLFTLMNETLLDPSFESYVVYFLYRKQKQNESSTFNVYFSLRQRRSVLKQALFSIKGNSATFILFRKQCPFMLSYLINKITLPAEYRVAEKESKWHKFHVHVFKYCLLFVSQALLQHESRVIVKHARELSMMAHAIEKPSPKFRAL